MRRTLYLFSIVVLLFSVLKVNAQQTVVEQQWLNNFELSNYKNKVVYLDFWASWCVPCRKSFPWLNEMQAKYQDQGLVVIAVNLDRDINKAHKFVTAFPASFLLFSDPKGILAMKYKVTGMPSSYLFSGDGELKETHVGFTKSEVDKYEANIVKLLEQLASK
jgi:cytochrome c biogenesis protein CcmG/thiol:disulfide interchange protein DsbE